MKSAKSPHRPSKASAPAKSKPGPSKRRKRRLTLVKCPCCFYRKLTGREWPEGWGVQPVMGLTDPKGKMIYLSDGLSLADANSTLIHEFHHMEGKEAHDEEFTDMCDKYERAAKRKRLVWEGFGD